ncbi:kelch-like protein 33 [Diretmus argenteus]
MDEDPEQREQGQRKRDVDLETHLVLDTEYKEPWRSENGKWKKGENDHLEKLNGEEEESTDDEEEEAECSLEDESDEEDVLRVYSQDGHSTDMSHSLKEFRDSSLLTDLTLSTEDGKSFQVHAPVLAAVSSLIRERLTGNDEERGKGGDDEMDVEVHKGSTMFLGPEVDHVGLQAVLEFAYTGAMLALNRDTVGQIKAAAQTLGVPRVTDVCAVAESLKYREQKKEQSISAAEQMQINLQAIRELWMEDVGCNVTLKALGASFHVHRVILAASSDYFRGMFTCGMKESYQPCVTLPFLLSSELEALIGCSYSGTLPLSWGCVFEITQTSLQLQYQPALSLCLSFMQQEINPHSCLDVASFAEAYEMAKLLEVADDFVLRQFQKVALTYKFKDLSAKQLLKYLSSHSLCVPSELVVFKAVVAWIQAKPKSRLRLAKELMKTIHFALMTFKEFKEVHRTMNTCSDHSLVELYQTVFDEFCSNDTAPWSQWRLYLPKQSLVLVGGDQISEDFGSRRTSRELWFVNSFRMGNVKAMEWRKLGEMPEPARISHEVAVLKGQLYVIAGRRYYGTNDILNSAYRYDPLQGSWERLADMHQKRCCFSVVVLDEMLYAIGGDAYPHCSGSVERYCHTTNCWSFTQPLDEALCAHAACVLHNQIFVSGGLNSGYQCLASMFLYHPEKGTTYLADMTASRAHHCMEIMGGHLYVAGGTTTDKNMATVDQLACEVYNPVANAWTAFTSLSVPHVGAGSAVFEDKFYVLGGYTEHNSGDTRTVHRYDPTMQQWENMGKMPGPNTDIRAAVLCLPPHLRL